MKNIKLYGMELLIELEKIQDKSYAKSKDGIYTREEIKEAIEKREELKNKLIEYISVF